MKKEKVWSETGHGTIDYVDSYKRKLNFHVLNSGKISRTKFISIVSKITHRSKSDLYDHVVLAGNDIEFLHQFDDDKIVFTTEYPRSTNDVLLKFDFDGNLVWMRNDIDEKDQKMIFDKYGELKNG